MNRVSEPQPGYPSKLRMAASALVATIALSGCFTGERRELGELEFETTDSNLEDNRYFESFLEDPSVITEARTIVSMSANTVEKRCREDGIDCPVFLSIPNREDVYAPNSSEYMRVISYESDDNLPVKVHLFSTDEMGADAGQISGMSMLKYTDKGSVSSVAYIHVEDNNLVYGYGNGATPERPLKGSIASFETVVNFYGQYSYDSVGVFNPDGTVEKTQEEPKAVSDSRAQSIFYIVQNFINPNL